jgi:hypothetical protein
LSGSKATFIEEIIEAHGGRCLWDDIEWLEADLSVRGFLLTAKHTPALNHIRVRTSTRTPPLFFLRLSLCRTDR